MSEIITDKLTGKTSAGDVDVTSEGGAVTMQLQQGLAKAWINFNGTGTIASRNTFNTTSLTDVGTGNYSFDFVNDMNNNDYAITGGARSPAVASGLLNAPPDAESEAATDSLEFYALSLAGNPTDFNHIYVVVHGDLA